MLAQNNSRNEKSEVTHEGLYDVYCFQVLFFFGFFFGFFFVECFLFFFCLFLLFIFILPTTLSLTYFVFHPYLFLSYRYD